MMNLQEILYECQRELDTLSIPYGNVAFITQGKMKTSWGTCKKYPNGTYSIKISDRLLNEDSSIKGLKATIVHELLHTCPGCMNHGAQWKAYAKAVNQKYDYSVQRCNSAEEKGVSPEAIVKSAKYAFKCKKCGSIITRERRSKFTMHPERFRCSLCKGSFTRIK